MSGSKVGWIVFRTVTTLAAVAVAKKAVDVGFKVVTGSEPPENPEDPDVTGKQALAWAIASAAGVAVAQLLATRTAAKKWRAWTGELPPGIRRDA